MAETNTVRLLWRADSWKRRCKAIEQRWDGWDGDWVNSGVERHNKILQSMEWQRVETETSGKQQKVRRLEKREELIVLILCGKQAHFLIFIISSIFISWERREKTWACVTDTVSQLTQMAIIPNLKGRRTWIASLSVSVIKLPLTEEKPSYMVHIIQKSSHFSFFKQLCKAITYHHWQRRNDRDPSRTSPRRSAPSYEYNCSRLRERTEIARTSFPTCASQQSANSCWTPH